jgi:hypothetical protein
LSSRVVVLPSRFLGEERKHGAGEIQEHVDVALLEAVSKPHLSYSDEFGLGNDDEVLSEPTIGVVADLLEVCFATQGALAIGGDLQRLCLPRLPTTECVVDLVEWFLLEVEAFERLERPHQFIGHPRGAQLCEDLLVE